RIANWRGRRAGCGARAPRRLAGGSAGRFPPPRRTRARARWIPASTAPGGASSAIAALASGPAPALHDRRAAGRRSRRGRLLPMRRRVTFSRNVTLSLSRSCVSHCKYCAFATHRPHLHEPDEVERVIDRAARRGVKELLVLTGDDPASVPGVGERLAALGFGLLPHTNLGALGGEDLARLRHVTASQGLMLESMRDDLVAHQASPTK